MLNGTTRLTRRHILGACMLMLTAATGPRASAAEAVAVPQDPAQPAPLQAPARLSVSQSARNWWLGLLASLAAGLGAVALLARRRSRQEQGQSAAYGEAWQGIGGPSYAPRPATPKTEPVFSGVQEVMRISGRADGLQQVAEALRRPFGVPSDFDTPEFLASAKQSFVRLQAAWDRSDLHELDECTTDEMFSALTHELRVRAGPSRTEVIDLTASLLGIETAAGEHRASVRFSGNLKVNGEEERLDEVWNLSKAADGSGGWLLAGIQQLN